MSDGLAAIGVAGPIATNPLIKNGNRLRHGRRFIILPSLAGLTVATIGAPHLALTRSIG
jgi:hypothetical protein